MFMKHEVKDMRYKDPIIFSARNEVGSVELREPSRILNQLFSPTPGYQEQIGFILDHYLEYK